MAVRWFPHSCSLDFTVDVTFSLFLVTDCGVDFAGAVALVLFISIGAGLLVAACTLGRFENSSLRGSPHFPEGRVRFPDCS